MSTEEFEKQGELFIITSRKNPTVSDFRLLLRERKEREKAGVFVIEGIKMTEEAVKTGCVFTQIMMTAAAEQKYTERLKSMLKSVPVTIISEDIAEYISDTKTPQGIFAAIKTLDKVEIG